MNQPQAQSPGVPSSARRPPPTDLTLKEIAVAALYGFAVMILVGLFLLFLIQPLGHEAWYDLARSMVIFVAALGALPAGYISYRRQQTLEAQRQVDRDKHELAFHIEQNRLRELNQALERAKIEDRRKRLGDATVQLGSDKAAVRVSGVYSLCHLADEWPEMRQTIANILCAYLRMPFDSAEASAPNEALVRRLVLEEIVARLRVPSGWPPPPAALPDTSWSMLSFDISGAYLVDATFAQVVVLGSFVAEGARFAGEKVDLSGASFSGRFTNFSGAKFEAVDLVASKVRFDGGAALFEGTEFHADSCDFNEARFLAGHTSFIKAYFASGDLVFDSSTFKDASFDEARFFGGSNSWNEVQMIGDHASFVRAKFGGDETSFNPELFANYISAQGAEFRSKQTSFEGIRVEGKTRLFEAATVAGAVTDRIGNQRVFSTPSPIDVLVGVK